jgi:uncharacterized protein YhbP (UPF0306 family)
VTFIPEDGTSPVTHHQRIHNTPIVTTATVQNNQAASTNQCHYTFDVCGSCFVLAGELKNHKSGTHGENSQSQQVHSHHKFCDSCGVDFNFKHHNDAGKDK